MHTLHGSTASHHATWITILLGSIDIPSPIDHRVWKLWPCEDRANGKRRKRAKTIQPGLRNHRDLPKHCILRHQNFTVASHQDLEHAFSRIWPGWPESWNRRPNRPWPREPKVLKHMRHVVKCKQLLITFAWYEKKKKEEMKKKGKF